MTQQDTLPLRKWKPYLVYKDSGVGWLGEVPAHWEVKRLKNITQINPEVLPEDTDPDYALQYIDITNVNDKGSIIDVQEMRFDEAPSRARRKVGHDDTIISTVRTYLKAIGFINNPPENLIVSTGFAVLRTMAGVKPGFLWRLVQSQQFVDSVVSHSEGVSYPGINPSRLACLPILLPPVEEQAAITCFIDQETAKIDALVAKKVRQIELLQEKRSALISRAVTRGLDPNAPLKDSSIDWLGHIPAHWEVFLLKRIARIRYGLGQPPEESYQGLPLIRATNVTYGRITKNGMMYVDPEDVPASRGAELISGEILVVRSGAYTGDSAIVPEEYAGAIAGYDMVATVFKGYSPFIAWQILSSEIRDLQFGFYKLRAAQPHLNAEELKFTVIVFPPHLEQQEIATFLDKETSKIDALITKIREGIDRLKEYRTALIAAAVTGKIDVRQEVSS
jgi:type I restriction enzyme S subunit